MKRKFLVAITAVAFVFLTACDNGASSNDDDERVLNDSRDGQVYKIVKIGDQVWMAENLKYEIPVASGASPSSFCYENREESCKSYGRLYTWTEAVNVCPKGWHLPDSSEWNKLFIAVGGKQLAGEKLKSADSIWYYGGQGTDEFGFGALPAGFSKGFNGFYDFRKYGNFWTTTNSDDSNAYHVTVFYNKKSADYIVDPKSYALSVRCLKN